MLNEYYATLTAKQQKLLQEKTTPGFMRQKDNEDGEEKQQVYSTNFLADNVNVVNVPTTTTNFEDQNNVYQMMRQNMPET